MGCTPEQLNVVVNGLMRNTPIRRACTEAGIQFYELGEYLRTDDMAFDLCVSARAYGLATTCSDYQLADRARYMSLAKESLLSYRDADMAKANIAGRGDNTIVCSAIETPPPSKMASCYSCGETKLSVEDGIKRITNELTEILLSKNHDYGNSGMKPPMFVPGLTGYEGLLVRLGDKVNRLTKLMEHTGKPQVNESVEDTLMDMAGYAVLLVYMRRSIDKAIGDE